MPTAAERRLAVVSRHLNAPSYWGRSLEEITSYREALLRCREELRAFIDKENCAPILIRLAWHDAGTFDGSVRSWPACGGANGSIRFDEEISHGANAGLRKALSYLQPFKERHSELSWADVIQLAGAVAVATTGGPHIPFKYGRLDAPTPAREGNLPDAKPPFGDGASSAAAHLRNVFGRMGFDDQEIVALSGAHTLGRAFKQRSGVTEAGYGDKAATPATASTARARADGQAGVGMPGGAAWCEKWLSFDNEYFHKGRAQHFLWLPTDAALHQDPGFRPHFERYRRDAAAFAQDFSAAFKKLSELGSKFDPPEGIPL